ncbi:NUT family member 1 [Ochotona princeps]|uniref:NUT family member 1 n=1 Tax=Ochotona princeps TaxID=9978 RepID=UPI00271453A1|nr:NUT family member 1 [Ochotona princeps]
MASDETSPLPGPDMAVKPGAALFPFTALPFPPPTPGAPDPPPWDPPPQPPVPPAFSPGNPHVLSAFPGPMLMMGEEGPGPTGVGAGKVTLTVKTEGGAAESSQAHNLVLTPTTFNWIAAGTPCWGPEAPHLVKASAVKTILPAKAAGLSQEGSPAFPPQAPPAAAHLAPMVPLEKAWLGSPGAAGEGEPAMARSKPPLGALSYTSKGVYENFRRWQRYKALAGRHLSQSPDTEALSCFLIPVLRSLARLKPTMTLEEGLPRAVQEWERTSNFDRMIFYEMAEKFMEFEAEEQMQIQNTQLLNEAQSRPPAAPLPCDPPGPPAPEVCQQPVYIPKKTTSKARAPRRRQRKPQKPPAPEAPKEIPPEAVKEYIDIMEGLLGSHPTYDPGESSGTWEQEEERQEGPGEDPESDFLSYIDDLCSQEVFVSQVEAVINPQFLEDLLSPEQQRDPLALLEELEEEEQLTLSQLVQKRILALEEEDGEAFPSSSGAQSDSSASVSDEEEDVGGRRRPSPGPRGAGGAVRLGKAAVAVGKRAREVHGGQKQALEEPRGVRMDGITPLSSSSWDLQLGPAAPRRVQAPLGTERGGSGEVGNQVSAHLGDHVGSAGRTGYGLMANKTSKAPPGCWQEDPQPERDPGLDVRFTELAPLPEPGSEKQVGELQEGQMGALGGLAQGKKLPGVSQGGSSKVRWGADQSPPVVPGHTQNHSPRVVRAGDRAPLSLDLWLNSEMDNISLELPLQIEEVIQSLQDGACITELPGSSQALGSESTAPGDMGDTADPCGGTVATPALEKGNDCSTPGPLPQAKSPAVMRKEDKAQSPETLKGRWPEGCSPLLESTARVCSPGSSVPAGPDSFPTLETPEASLPKASQVTGDLLETTDQVNKLDIRNDCGLQQGLSEATCPPCVIPKEAQGEGREDLALLQENPQLHAAEASNCTSPQGLAGTAPKWGNPAAPPVSQKHSSHGARGRKKEKRRQQRKELDEEDEELINFANLLACKLRLEPRGPVLSPQPTSGQGVQNACAPPSAEARGLGKPLYSAAKSGKRVLVGGSAPTEKRACPDTQLGASGEEPSALGVVQASQPRKRRRDSFVTGRRKKRRRSQ